MKKYVQIQSKDKIALFDTENISSIVVQILSPSDVYLSIVGKTEGIDTFRFASKEEALEQYVAIKDALINSEEL